MILAMLKSWWESSFAEVARKSWGKPQGWMDFQGGWTPRVFFNNLHSWGEFVVCFRWVVEIVRSGVPQSSRLNGDDGKM